MSQKKRNNDREAKSFHGNKKSSPQITEFLKIAEEFAIYGMPLSKLCNDPEETMTVGNMICGLFDVTHDDANSFLEMMVQTYLLAKNELITTDDEKSDDGFDSQIFKDSTDELRSFFEVMLHTLTNEPAKNSKGEEAIISFNDNGSQNVKCEAFDSATENGNAIIQMMLNTYITWKNRFSNC